MRERLKSLSNGATSILALAGAAGILAMLVHVCVYVVSRNLFQAPVPATVEIVSRYYMIALAFLPIAWADRRGDMIAVEVLDPLMKGWWKIANSAFVITLSLAAYGALAYTTWFKAMREFGVRSFVVSLNIAIPVWPTYFLVPLAFGLATLVCVVKLYLLFTEPHLARDAPPASPGVHE